MNAHRTSAKLRTRFVALVVAVALAGSPVAAQTPAASEQSASTEKKALPQFGTVNPMPAPALPPVTPSASPLPDLGDAAQADFSPAQERKLGETVIRQLRASGAYMNDPEVNDYLNELGHRLMGDLVPATERRLTRTAPVGALTANAPRVSPVR